MIFQKLFEYDVPLFRRGPGKFEFIELDDTDYQNPWKESFRQLHRGVHVRPGAIDLYSDEQSGRNILCVATIQAALTTGGDNPLIFIHAHLQPYLDELLVIDTNAEVNPVSVWYYKF